MKDHSLPQNVTNYQFHLVGSMTLKQFLFVAVGIAATWIFWSLPIIIIFKYPLMGISIISGILFAFVPYQDRPLDLWLTSFIKTIYSPTQFLWKKTPQTPEFLKPSTKPTKPIVSGTQSSPSQKQTPLKTYLQSIPKDPDQTPIDAREAKALQNINNLFQTVASTSVATPKPIAQPQPITKNLKVKVRKLKTPPPKFSADATPLSIIKESPPPQPKITQPKPKQITKQIAAPTISKSKQKTTPAIINPRLPFPTTPTTPNIIVGMTLDPQRNILENTIIEIKDSKGYTVRALKSNKLGQFFIATPLPNGTYEISIEKEGFKFNPINLKLTGKITSPIEIRANSTNHQGEVPTTPTSPVTSPPSQITL